MFHPRPVANSDFIEVYPLSMRFLSDSEQRPIEKEFKRAAAAFANYLARNTNRKKQKNRELARGLTRMIRECDFRVFSKVSPDREGARRPKNLVFLLLTEEDRAEFDQRGNNKSVSIAAPRKKISLPYNLIERGDDTIIESFIPGDSETFRITLPLSARSLANSGRKAKNIALAFAQGSRKATMPTQQPEDDYRDIQRVVRDHGSHLRRANRVRTRHFSPNAYRA